MPIVSETPGATATERHLERSRRHIPGGLFSMNRRTDPMIVFERAQGAYLWDVEGRRYLDYHAAFAPYFLGHADPDVDGAVIAALQRHASLFGAGTTPWEGELAELLVESVPTLDQVQVTNTGSEATAYAIRLARAATGRDGILLMQGGYNGWEDDVAFNLMDPADTLKPRDDGPGLALRPITNGIPAATRQNVYVVQFNDLDAAEAVLKTGKIAALMLEPVLQNIGVVKPLPGYLEGLRRLCDAYGTLLVFDEVKTGFRNGLGGYQALCGVRPDLSTFGKAVANGYPLGVIGGRAEYMRYFDHPDLKERVLIAGTYNGHPVPVFAAIATLKKLRDRHDDEDRRDRDPRLPRADAELDLRQGRHRPGRPLRLGRGDARVAHPLRRRGDRGPLRTADRRGPDAHRVPLADDVPPALLARQRHRARHGDLAGSTSRSGTSPARSPGCPARSSGAARCATTSAPTATSAAAAWRTSTRPPRRRETLRRARRRQPSRWGSPPSRVDGGAGDDAARGPEAGQAPPASRVAAMREAVGDDIDIMVDCHARPSPAMGLLRPKRSSRTASTSSRSPAGPRASTASRGSMPRSRRPSRPASA
jgi:glutamate-1-semialdehyde 2,1-aminomutase